jgi:hypothetical protein
MARRKQLVPKGSKPTDRILAWCTVTDDGCWVWQGCTRDRKWRYGRIMHKKRSWFTHILMFTETYGPVPNGLVLDHLCRNTLCCNPTHLQAVTQFENVMRGNGLCAINAAKTSCKSGHEFTPQNTYTYIRNGRQMRGCRICRNLASAKYHRSANR